MKRCTVLGVVLAGMLFSALPATAELLAVGTTAPDFTLKTLDGKPVTLSELRGKPVMLEFWASWCGPCRRQFPKMAEIHHRYEGKIHFLLVNTAETEAKVRDFGSKVPIPGTVLMDPEDRVGELYGTEILPSVFFIDASGTIKAAVPGALKDVEAFLKEMLE